VIGVGDILWAGASVKIRGDVVDAYSMTVDYRLCTLSIPSSRTM
jgi:hypothetical protein